MSSYKYKYTRMFIIYLHKYMRSCETILHEYENNYIFFKTLNIKPVKYEKMKVKNMSTRQHLMAVSKGLKI